ncbi:MAG: MaoC family dehydratase N-terminal domain-containing protein [Pseudomonadota bacterium]
MDSVDAVIGRQMVLTDRIDPWRAGALHATLDLGGAAPPDGAPLPHFNHWIYFLEAKPAHALGRDGHPARGEQAGGFIPDLGLPRRMWAGGQLQFRKPLVIGSEARRTTTIESIARKEGRTGPLAFVRLRHDIAVGGEIAVTEHQDIVYRGDPDTSHRPPAPPQAPSDATRSRTITCDPVMLFRYSALTFNGHRIHYDRDYATGVEGYAGLVVHGPLIAQLLLDLAEVGPLGPATTFSFRARSPAFDFEDITLCASDEGTTVAVWAKGPGGRLIMEGLAAA